MAKNFKRFECIDTLNIPDIVIYNCRKIYETWGKLKVYDELDQRMYKYDHGLDIKCERTLRYLNLYRQAYIQTKCAYMDSDVSDTDIKDVNTLSVDENKFCKYCGKPLKVNLFEPKPTLTTTLNISYSEEEYESLPDKVLITIPNEAYGDDIRFYSFTFNLNGVDLGTSQAIVGDNDPYTAIINKSCFIPGDNTLVITSRDLNGINNGLYNSSRLAYCDNKNCYLQLRFFKKTRWQYFNYNASVPKLDQITVGYVPVTGFSLDDYDYDYSYKNSILTMKKRGSGIGFPRTYRFDFEYRFVKSIPEYIEVYKDILYCTFRKSLYSSMIRQFDLILTPDEIKTISKMQKELDDSEKIELIKIVNDFVLFQKKYHDIAPEDESSLQDYNERKEYIVNELMRLHDKYILPIEFLSIFILYLVYPKLFVVSSDDMGGISSELVINGNISSASNPDSIFINKNHGKRIVDTCFIPEIPKVYNGGVTLYDNYYIMVDEDFGIEMYSFDNNKWLDHSDHNIFDINYDSNFGKFIKIINRNNNLVFVFENCIKIFDFVHTEWRSDIGENGTLFFDNIVDADFNDETDTFVVATSDKISILSMTGEELSHIYASHDYIYLDETDTDEYSTYELSTQPILNNFDKVFINEDFSINDSSNVTQRLDYITVTSREGDIQIFKITDNSSISLFKTVKFTKHSRVSSIFKIKDNQQVILAFENSRLFVFNTFMYNEYIVQYGKESDETLVYATHIYINKNMYISYVTNSNNSNLAYSYYSKNVNKSVSSIREPLSKLILNGSKIVTYDEFNVKQCDVELKISFTPGFGPLQQKERFISQR